MPSPLGEVVLTGSDDGLCGLYLGPGAPAEAAGLPRDDAAFQHVAGELAAWFAGTSTQLDVPVVLRGTPFQLSVWALLQQIPYGTTTTYGALAAELGKPGASRAVGAANGRNAVGIVVPCHRVVASDGSVHGFAGGVQAKRWLLDHEKARAGSALF